MTDPGTTPSARDLLRDADHRLIRAVDGLTDDAYAGPSLLPGWTRGHVVAHLVLNAEGIARALEGVAVGAPVAMYDSEQARDADIDTLAVASPSELRDRLLAATTHVGEAMDAMAAAGPEAGSVRLERSPGRPGLLAGQAADFRVREVEIHLVDLACGPSYDDWSPAFTSLLLDALAVARAGDVVAVVEPDGLDGTWRFGGEATAGPVLTGRGASLAWWLTGRGAGEGVTSETGRLPEIGAW